MHFEVLATCHTTRARVCRMKLSRTFGCSLSSETSVIIYTTSLDGVTLLPTFMPVATQAAIKGLTPQQVEGLGITLILNNTYHLNLRPGIKVLQEAGGAHRLQGWNHNLLTVRDIFIRSECISSGIQDSGGFQLVSLNKFTKIDEEGALFASPFTGDPTMLTVCVIHIYGTHSDLRIARGEYINTACHWCRHHHAA
jgi:queuine tRNA-ribosyltransferase